MKLCQILLTCLLIFAVSLSACKSKKDKDTKADSNSTEPGAAVKVDIIDEAPSKDIIVTVDGVDITEEVLEEKIQAEIDRRKVPMPPAFLKRYKQELRQKILDDMIVELLLDKEVQKNKIIVTEKDIDSYIRQLNANNRMSMKDFLEMLEAMGKSLDEYKQDLRKRLAHELLQTKLFDSIEISEEDAKKYYSGNPEEFQAVGQTNFEQARDAIIQRLYKDKQKELFNEYIAKLKQEAHIVYSPAKKLSPL